MLLKYFLYFYYSNIYFSWLAVCVCVTINIKYFFLIKIYLHLVLYIYANECCCRIVCFQLLLYINCKLIQPLEKNKKKIIKWVHLKGSKIILIREWGCNKHQIDNNFEQNNYYLNYIFILSNVCFDITCGFKRLVNERKYKSVDYLKVIV